MTKQTWTYEWQGSELDGRWASKCPKCGEWSSLREYDPTTTPATKVCHNPRCTGPKPVYSNGVLIGTVEEVPA